jgi:hypothetical protein
MHPFIYDPIDPKHEIRLLTIQPPTYLRAPSRTGGFSAARTALTAIKKLTVNFFNWASSDAVTEIVEETQHASPTICCSFSVVSVKDSPPYTALSYTWGDASQTKAIEVDEQQTTITSNLEQALQVLRDPIEPVTIWVDALCINQNDNDEKSDQVNLMRSIYENAASVGVWVGPEANDSDLVMHTFEKVGRQAFDAGITKLKMSHYAQLRSRDDATLDPDLASIKKVLDTLSDDIGLKFPYTAFNCFCARPYWTRIWIVQEISVAKEAKLLCGTIQLPLSHFVAAILFEPWHKLRVIRSHSVQGALRGPLMMPMLIARADVCAALVGARRRWQGETGNRDTLFELLIRTCLGNTAEISQWASNERDLVYGLLSMAADREKLGIKVDYQKSVEEVFTDTARALIERGGYTSILT